MKQQDAPMQTSNSSATSLSNDKKYSPNTLFVSNLKYDLDEAKLRSIFQNVSS
jgi:RNA recognition motif-containing protein